MSFGLKKATTLRGKRLLLSGNKFKVNCSADREMDVSTSAVVDGVADCLNGLCSCSFVVELSLTVHAC